MKSLFRPAVVLLIAVLAPLLLLGGCSSLGKKKSVQPAVAFAGLELQGIKGLETIFRLHLRVTNPDEAPLEVRGLSCELKISGTAFADGSSDEHVTVPASGSAEVSAQVYTSVFDLAGSVIELLQRGGQQQGKPLRYELTGRLRTGVKGEETAPFALKGELPPGQ